MEHTCLRQNSTTDRNGAGSLLVAGDYTPHVFSQRDDHEIQTNGSKTKANAHALKQQRPVRYGLPCVNCKAYYASDLSSCPICKCAKRVPATGTEAESTQTLNKPQGGVLQPALRSFINLIRLVRAGERCHRRDGVTRGQALSSWNPSYCCAPTQMKSMRAQARPTSWPRIATLKMNPYWYA